MEFCSENFSIFYRRHYRKCYLFAKSYVHNDWVAEDIASESLIKLWETAKLKELGIYDNTIILFTSDNGPTFNGGSDSPWFDSAKPFVSDVNWEKTSLREGGIRVPLTVTREGNIKKNTVSNHIMASRDIMPT